jgi:acyl dehydratase
MTLNPELEGKAFPPIGFTVDPEHVARFAKAVGEDGSFVPPTFATTGEIAALAQVIADPELGLDFARVVHGEQEYEWRRPLRPGDELSARPRIASVRARGGHEFLTVETEMRDPQGELVVLARNTLIVRGRR